MFKKTKFGIVLIWLNDRREGEIEREREKCYRLEMIRRMLENGIHEHFGCCWRR